MAETAMVSAQKLAAVVVAREDPLDQGAVEAAVSWVDATPAVEGGAVPIPWGQYTSEGYFLHTHRGLARSVCILLVLPHTDSDFNLYTYVGNSPQKYTDPMGLQMCWIPGKGDPVDSYIPWYDNPNGLSGTDWFAQFGLSWGEGIKKLVADGGNVSDWVIPSAEEKEEKEARKAAETVKDPNKGAKFKEHKNWFKETIREYDNGTVVTIRPNGEVTISHKDGTLTTITPNKDRSKPGTARTIRPDGTEVINPNGVNQNMPLRLPTGAPGFKPKYRGNPIKYPDHVA